MKHIIIGDLHGRDNWKQVDFAHYSKAVLLGDYYTWRGKSITYLDVLHKQVYFLEMHY